MRIGEMCIKVLAVAVALGAITVAYGREMLVSAFAENNRRNNGILVKNISEETSAIAEVENTVLERHKRSVIQGENGEMPFLCKSIKYSCRDMGDYFCFYNSNQELYYSSRTGIVVYYRYDCPVGEAKYSKKDCVERAKRAVRSSIPDVKNTEISEISVEKISERTVMFCVKIKMSDSVSIYIKLRRDTGSVILFDAREAEKWLLSEKNENSGG